MEPVIHINKEGFEVIEYFNNKNELHRDKGPAQIEQTVDGFWECFYKNGKLIKAVHNFVYK